MSVEKSMDSTLESDMTGRVGINLVSYYRVTLFSLVKASCIHQEKAL